MAVLNKGLWWILGAMALGLAISVSTALYQRGEAKTLRADLNATKADLVGLRKAYTQIVQDQKARTAVDVHQSSTRATKAQAVRAVRARIAKESANENASHPQATAAQLNRLRELSDAANAGIRSASKLP